MSYLVFEIVNGHGKCCNHIKNPRRLYRSLYRGFAELDGLTLIDSVLNCDSLIVNDHNYTPFLSHWFLKFLN
jgi:hypothetical protein